MSFCGLSSLKNCIWGEKMAYKFKKFGSYRERADFSKVGNSLELQDLLEIQKKSYEWFRTEGIKEVFIRGLNTRLITNGIQGLMFNIMWKYFSRNEMKLIDSGNLNLINNKSDIDKIA